jgi:hypothetical protein
MTAERLSQLQRLAAVVCHALSDAGMTILATALNELLVTRAPHVHHKWDEETRIMPASSTLASLNLRQEDEEELTTEAGTALTTLSQLSVSNLTVELSDAEVLPMQELGGVDLVEGTIRADQPADLIWGLLHLGLSESELKSYFMKSPRMALRDHTDWRQFKTGYVDRLVTALRHRLGEHFQDVLWWIAITASAVYGCTLERLKCASHVYLRGSDFHSQCGDHRSVIFSVTTDAISPIERYGTDWFLERYAIDPHSVGDLSLKNPFRQYNFARGVLSPELPGERVFVWEEQGTRQSLQSSYNLVPDEKKDLFVADAVALMEECLVFRQLALIELPYFHHWMRRFTRNGPNRVMVSFRGPSSKRICHAVNIQLTHTDTIREFRQLFLKLVGIAHTYSSGDLALLLLWALVLQADEWTHRQMEIFLGRGMKLDWPRDAAGARLIKPAGWTPATDAERRNLACKEIHRLLSA